MTCQLAQLAQLCSLRPLTIPTTCWPIEPDRLIARDPITEQYISITGSAGVRCYPENMREAIFGAVDMCQRHGACLSVHYSPWGNVFEHGESPYVERKVAQKEYRRAWDMFCRVERVIDEANQTYRSDVKVRWVLLDSEIFVVKPDDEDGATEWNAAIDKQHDTFYRMAKAAFSGAEVRWYDRGTTQGAWKRFTGNEPGDGYATSLYVTADLGRTRSHYNWAVRRCGDKVSPWICLGAGHEWWGDIRLPWCKTDIVPLQHSHILGYEMGHPDEFPMWKPVALIVLWPDPFHENYPDSWQHFIAWVRGMNGDSLLGHTGWKCPSA